MIIRENMRRRYSFDPETSQNVPLTDAYSNSEIRAFSRLDPVVVLDPEDQERHKGCWIFDDQVKAFLMALQPGGRLSHMTFNDVEAHFVHLHRDGRGGITEVVNSEDFHTFNDREPVHTIREGHERDKGDVVVVVYDEQRSHYFPVMIDRDHDGVARVYVYDSLGSTWSNSKTRMGRNQNRSVEKFVELLLQTIDFPDETKGTIIYDRTKDIVQTEASCGPWSLWLIMAFVSNIHNWRMSRPNPVFHTRHALSAYDLFGNRVPSRKNQLHLRFWASLQGRLYDDEEEELQSFT
ncbi:MAG: hypothetical protein ABEI52_08400 [Halobacteriaceae archaeon]